MVDGVAQPVQRLDAPVIAVQAGQLCWVGAGGGQAGDTEDGDGGAEVSVRVADVAFDEGDLVDVWKREIVWCGQDLDGAAFDATVGSDRFEFASGGRQLRTDTADSIHASALLFGSEEVWRSWTQLAHSVRTGTVAWDSVIGTNVFEFMSQHAEKSAIFNAAMAERTRLIAPRIAASYDFSRHHTVVDVGGGDGTLIATILSATPTLRGILFDTATGVQAAGATLHRSGVSDRCEIVAGDFLASVPDGADAYLLKTVIHNWDDAHATTILGNCRKAMSNDATVLIVERVLPPLIDSPTASHAALMDINMLVTTGGRERTEKEYRSLLSAGGFTLSDIVATGSDSSGYHIMVGSPA